MSGTRLSWWAVALPVAVFTALLTVLVTTSEADENTAGQLRPVPQLAEVVRAFWPA